MTNHPLKKTIRFPNLFTHPTPVTTLKAQQAPPVPCRSVRIAKSPATAPPIAGSDFQKRHRRPKPIFPSSQATRPNKPSDQAISPISAPPMETGTTTTTFASKMSSTMIKAADWLLLQLFSHSQSSLLPAGSLLIDLPSGHSLLQFCRAIFDLCPPERSNHNCLQSIALAWTTIRSTDRRRNPINLSQLPACDCVNAPFLAATSFIPPRDWVPTNHLACASPVVILGPSRVIKLPLLFTGNCSFGH